MKVVYEEKFKKQLKGIKDKQIQKKVRKQIKKILENPRVGVFLSYNRFVRKVYVVPFRLLYRYENDTLFFLDFGHRSRIYKKLK
jgi:mRNA-degrading endonuclease RelE of RelBE toxin-antitoxin system